MSVVVQDVPFVELVPKALLPDFHAESSKLTFFQSEAGCDVTYFHSVFASLEMGMIGSVVKPDSSIV
jgi:hypothetical protein